jgi:hypothetical protein
LYAFSLEKYVASIGSYEIVYATKKSRLARTGWAEHCYHISFSYIKGDLLENFL